MWAEIELPNLHAVDWRTAATVMARDLYAVIIRHPWLVPAMSTHLIYGPGKARHDDHSLAVFEAAGFTGQDADQAATVVFTFVLGMALGATSEIAWLTRVRHSKIRGLGDWSSVGHRGPFASRPDDLRLRSASRLPAGPMRQDLLHITLR